MPMLACSGGARSSVAPSTGPVAIAATELTDGWSLRSADEVTDPGDAIATVGYPTTGWHPVTLPSTVLAGLVADGVYPDIYRGTNLADVPDLTKQQWWYRGEFTAPAAGAGQRAWLRFEGISYRAQIWVNGVELDHDAVGTMVEHEYDVTDLIHPGAANAVAVLVTPPRHRCRDLSFCTVDWNPEAPDMNAGLWGSTVLEMTGPVALRDPYVRTELPLPRTNQADLTAYVDAVNGTDQPVTTSVDATIDRAGHPPITLTQNVTLDPNERREVVFDPATYPELHVEHPGPMVALPVRHARPVPARDHGLRGRRHVGSADHAVRDPAVHRCAPDRARHLVRSVLRQRPPDPGPRGRLHVGPDAAA